MLNTEINKRFSNHCLSNSKWVKLIEKIVENSIIIRRIEFKKVLSEEIGTLYIDENTTFEFDYWKSGFEGLNSFGGWLMYKEIEYLIFPKYFSLEKKNEYQDIIEIKNIIKTIGQFEFITEGDNLKLLCYK